MSGHNISMRESGSKIESFCVSAVQFVLDTCRQQIVFIFYGDFTVHLLRLTPLHCSFHVPPNRGWSHTLVEAVTNNCYYTHIGHSIGLVPRSSAKNFDVCLVCTIIH